MENEYIFVKVYSIFKHTPQPDEIITHSNCRYIDLVNKYLAKYNLQSIDPNLIKVNIIRSTDKDLLNENKKIIDVAKQNQIISDRKHEYFLSMELGVLIKVNIVVDKKLNYNRNISISTETTANQLFHLLVKSFPITITNTHFNLHHNSEKLKPNELPAMIVQRTGSIEFKIELNQISQNEEIIKTQILRQLKTDYQRIISPTGDYLVSKSINNLSKVLYHNSQKIKQRKLPQLTKTVKEDMVHFYYHITSSPEDKLLVGDMFEKERKRSLPRTPHLSPTIKENNVQTILDNGSLSVEKISITSPPEPIIKTNALVDEMDSSSSSSSHGSINENDICCSSPDDKARGSVIPRAQSKNIDFCSPNMFQLVKYCNLMSIDLSVKSSTSSHFPIELKESVFQTLVTLPNNRPSGPTPVLGCDKSAFATVETDQEKRRFVVIVDNIHQAYLNFCNGNIEIGDILVDIDGENVLSTHKEYIYSKLTGNIKHEVIIARYKHLSVNFQTKKKDQKISELKNELDNLKKKYFALHNVTIGNNQVIQQLNKELKHKQLTSIVNIE